MILPVPLSVLAIYGLSFLGDFHLDSTMLFTGKVTVQLTSLQFALIPILFLAGVDFAEWGEMSMERVAMLVRAASRPALALAASALGALLVLGISVYDDRQALFVSRHVWPLLGATAMGLVTVGVLALLALILNGSLQVVSWVYDLLGAAMEVSSHFTVAGAVIIILALLWDATMPGETITNVDGAIFPRRSRVLLFFGYMSVTATNLLYFSTLTVQATGAHLEAQFESDVWVQNGLMLLGVPLLLTLFLLRLGRWRHASGDATSAGEETGEAGIPGIPGIPSIPGITGAPTQEPDPVAAATVVR